MTLGTDLDREQIKRDAEWSMRNAPHFVNGEAAEHLARHCLALLAALEQAEQDRDEARRIADVWRRKRDYTLETKLAAEARLAKVPALVEAIKQCFGTFEDGRVFVDAGAEDTLHDVVKPALADYEGEG